MKEHSQIDLLDFATLLAKRKKTFFGIVLICTLVGFALAFIWPKSYKSELSFIVTDGNAINFSSGGLLSGLANLSVDGSNVTADQVLVLIRNKVIQDKVIAKFDLMEIYGTDIPEALRKKLNDRIIIEETREGGLGFNNIIAISISYIDGEPQRAFDLLDYYYNEVEAKVEDLNRKNVEDGFLLLKSRLEQNELELRAAEDSLVSFQTRHGILEVEEQAKVQVQAIAQLKSEIVKMEIELGYLTEVLGENSSRVANLNLQKAELESKYDELLSGDSLPDGSFDIFKSASEMPDLFLEYLRRYRDVIVQEEIYKVLFPQFEQQKLNYEEVSSGLRIIDPALVPTYKNGPKRAYIILAAFLFGCFFALLSVLFKEWRSNLEENKPEDYQRLKEFSGSLKSW